MPGNDRPATPQTHRDPLNLFIDHREVNRRSSRAFVAALSLRDHYKPLSDSPAPILTAEQPQLMFDIYFVRIVFITRSDRLSRGGFSVSHVCLRASWFSVSNVLSMINKTIELPPHKR